MDELTLVLLLLIFGLILVIVEVILIPGTTVVGVAGFVCLVVGIVLAFRNFGSEVGWITLGIAATTSGALIYLAFRTDVWRRFALKSTIDGKMNEIETLKFPLGMEGTALSALRPSGKGEFGINTAEVRTLGEYVESGSRLRIIKLMSNQIIVEKI